MTKSSENKMLSKIASSLKLEWAKLSEREKKCYIIEMITMGYLCVLIVLILHGEVNENYTIADAAKGIGAICGCVLIYTIGRLFRHIRENIRVVERKKKGLRPEWTDQDLDILDENVEDLYERVKALENRRY